MLCSQLRSGLCLQIRNVLITPVQVRLFLSLFLWSVSYALQYVIVFMVTVSYALQYVIFFMVTVSYALQYVIVLTFSLVLQFKDLVECM
jgi:hypothetical protein